MVSGFMPPKITGTPGYSTIISDINKGD